jgi:hypothetical protein
LPSLPVRALEKPGPAAAWIRLDAPLVEGQRNTRLLRAVQAADFTRGVAQIRHLVGTDGAVSLIGSEPNMLVS